MRRRNNPQNNAKFPRRQEQLRYRQIMDRAENYNERANFRNNRYDHFDMRNEEIEGLEEGYQSPYNSYEDEIRAFNQRNVPGRRGGFVNAGEEFMNEEYERHTPRNQRQRTPWNETGSRRNPRWGMEENYEQHGYGRHSEMSNEYEDRDYENYSGRNEQGYLGHMNIGRGELSERNSREQQRRNPQNRNQRGRTTSRERW